MPSVERFSTHNPGKGDPSSGEVGAEVEREAGVVIQPKEEGTQQETHPANKKNASPLGRLRMGLQILKVLLLWRSEPTTKEIQWIVLCH